MGEINKVKYNLVGDTFTHLTGGNLGYSVHGKKSKHIEWVQDGSGVGTFFVDLGIRELPKYLDNPGPKYLWLLESKWITGAYTEFYDNAEYYHDNFDLIFTHSKGMLGLSDKFKFVPAQGSWITTELLPKWALPNKRHLVSMIASNKDWTEGHRKRLKWVETLRNTVHLYGRGFSPIPFKEQGLFDYMFSVAIENGQYETYFTEKILDCFLSLTVPVYLGAPDIGDYFNMDGIIVLTDDFAVWQLSKDRYESMLPAIADNYQRALKMEVLEDYIWINYLAG